MEEFEFKMAGLRPNGGVGENTCGCACTNQVEDDQAVRLGSQQ